MELSLSQYQLRQLIKNALVEVLEERRDLLYDAVEEALENIPLAKAIDEGSVTEMIQREEVFDILACEGDGCERGNS